MLLLYYILRSKVSLDNVFEPFNVFAQVYSLVSFITSYSFHGPIQSSKYVRHECTKTNPETP